MRLSTVLTFMALLSTLWSATAQANRFETPFPGEVRTVVGTFEFWGSQIVGICFESIDTPSVDPYGIWLSLDRLTENHSIFLGTDKDLVEVMPPGKTTTACGTTFGSVDHNGYMLTFYMDEGNDTFKGGSNGVVRFDGGPGNDRFHIYTSYMQVWANSGDDKIWNHTPYSFASYFYGQEGADCIQSRPGDFVDCGDGPPYIIDVTTASASGSSRCELTGAYQCRP